MSSTSKDRRTNKNKACADTGITKHKRFRPFSIPNSKRRGRGPSTDLIDEGEGRTNETDACQTRLKWNTNYSAHFRRQFDMEGIPYPQPFPLHRFDRWKDAQTKIMRTRTWHKQNTNDVAHFRHQFDMERISCPQFPLPRSDRWRDAQAKTCKNYPEFFI